MLREINHIRQNPGKGIQRWFCDDYFDLTVWFEDEKPVGFQLCYDINSNDQRALTWFSSEKWSHLGVDDGEGGFGRKSTPVLIADGLFDDASVMSRFERESGLVPADIRDLVLKAIAGRK